MQIPGFQEFCMREKKTLLRKICLKNNFFKQIFEDLKKKGSEIN